MKFMMQSRRQPKFKTVPTLVMRDCTSSSTAPFILSGRLLVSPTAASSHILGAAGSGVVGADKGNVWAADNFLRSVQCNCLIFGELDRSSDPGSNQVAKSENRGKCSSRSGLAPSASANLLRPRVRFPGVCRALGK